VWFGENLSSRLFHAGDATWGQGFCADFVELLDRKHKPLFFLVNECKVSTFRGKTFLKDDSIHFYHERWSRSHPALKKRPSEVKITTKEQFPALFFIKTSRSPATMDGG